MLVAAPVKLADTHCHLDLDRFDSDRDEVLERARLAGLTRILVPGLDLASSRRVVALAESAADIFAAIGVHPNDSQGWDGGSLPGLRQLYSETAPGKIVAIGEIGLDYYWDAAPRDLQHEVLRAQLGLAAELGLPVILHLREKDDAQQGECATDLLGLLEEWIAGLVAQANPLVQAPGVLHSFSGSLATAQKVLGWNFLVGITGPVTYKNAEVRREVVKSLPLARMLIETDAPFLAPVPKRGLRNEPAFVRYIADKIAEIQLNDPEVIAAQTSANAARLFSWGG